jgi:DNA-binding NarL/FixJ family response regulator
VTGEPIRILVADEESLFREAVKVVLEAEPDLEVVAVASDGIRAISEAVLLAPDVALLSAGLAGNRGVATAFVISKRVPQCRILILSATEDLRTLVDAIQGGASGYLTKDSPISAMLEAVRAVHADRISVPDRVLPALIRELVRRMRAHSEATVWLTTLTAREREVLELLASGADNAAIGGALKISPQTARTHVQNILSKLGLHSRLEVAMFARRSGISELVTPPLGALEDVVAAAGGRAIKERG